MLTQDSLANIKERVLMMEAVEGGDNDCRQLARVTNLRNSLVKK